MIVFLLDGVIKKSNSLSIPRETSRYPAPGQLKENTSIMAPSILFDTSWHAGGAPQSYTYAYIPEFGRYYYITDWVYDAPHWRADMRVDVLASFCKAILKSRQYVTRSATVWNEDIVDVQYPTSEPIHILRPMTQPPFTPYLHQGSYCVGVINSGGSQSAGAVTYYILTADEFSLIMQYLLSDPNWMGIEQSEISFNLQKALVDPLRYIVSCMWFPFAAQNEFFKTSSFKVGWWEIPMPKQIPIYSGIEDTTYTFDTVVPEHPQANFRGAYLNYAPYTTYKLFFPPFGDIPLRPEWIKNTKNHLYLYITIDYVTGLAVLKVGQQQGNPYFTFFEKTAQMGVPIAMAQLSNNIVSNLATGVSSIPDVVRSALSLDIGGALGSAVTGIESTILTKTPDVESIGTSGSTIGYNSIPQLHCEFLPLVDEDLAHFGRPLCREMTIDDLSGFAKCASPDWSNYLATRPEEEEVNRLLSTGIFVESHLSDFENGGWE